MNCDAGKVCLYISPIYKFNGICKLANFANVANFPEVYPVSCEVVNCKESEGCLSAMQVVPPMLLSHLSLRCKAPESESDNERESVETG